MIVTMRSTCTDATHTVDIPNLTLEQFERWGNGKGGHIQDVLGHLSEDEREFLLTGCTPQEWDDLMTDDSEEIDDDTPPF